MKPHLPFLILLTFALQACGGGGGGDYISPKVVETYVTDHNKRNRVRVQNSLNAEERAALADFDTKGTGPAGYLSLIDLKGTPYEGEMTIEAIASVSTATGKATRLLRLTADQGTFVNNGEPVTPPVGSTEPSGVYHFRGMNYAWVTIDNGPLLSGYHATGLEHLQIDFNTGMATFDLRTEQSAGSDVRIELRGDLPFNVTTGAWGGDVTIQVWDPNSPLQGSINGTLLGNIGGTTGFANNQHDMTTSGLYTGSGTVAEGGRDHAITVDGVFFGQDPNAAP